LLLVKTAGDILLRNTHAKSKCLKFFQSSCIVYVREKKQSDSAVLLQFGVC